jgi:hypothetical protein
MFLRASVERTKRELLVGILLKYAGVVVPLGETETEREMYLSVACRASEYQQSWDGGDMEENEYQRAPWSELAYLILRGANKSYGAMKNVLV